MKTTNHGNIAGTLPGTAFRKIREPLQRKVSRPAETRHRELTTLCPAWPRLLTVEMAGSYLGLSKWTVIELIHGGHIRPVPVPRPRTAKAMKTRPLGETMRRQLVDRLELDALVDQWRESR